MGLNVVFTGPAFDGAGRPIVRADLTYACIEKGIAVQPNIACDTHVLVASRLDTVKAKRAYQQGLKVVTYPEFLSAYLVGVELQRGAKPNKYTDVVDPDLLVPDFTCGASLEALDVL